MRNQPIAFCLALSSFLLCTPPAQAEITAGCQVMLFPPGISCGVGIDVQDVWEIVKNVGKGVAQIFFGAAEQPLQRVVYSRYEPRSTGSTSSARTFTVVSPQLLQPTTLVSYTPDSHHPGAVLRLMYRNIRQDNRIPLYGNCAVLIEDGISGRPDGALRFTGCGFEGYALYYPLATPEGTQLSVWADGISEPVLIINRRGDTLVILEQHSTAGAFARQILFGGVS